MKNRRENKAIYFQYEVYKMEIPNVSLTSLHFAIVHMLQSLKLNDS